MYWLQKEHLPQQAVSPAAGPSAAWCLATRVALFTPSMRRLPFLPALGQRTAQTRYTSAPSACGQPTRNGRASGFGVTRSHQSNQGSVTTSRAHAGPATVRGMSEESRSAAVTGLEPGWAAALAPVAAQITA